MGLMEKCFFAKATGAALLWRTSDEMKLCAAAVDWLVQLQL